MNNMKKKLNLLIVTMLSIFLAITSVYAEAKCTAEVAAKEAKAAIIGSDGTTKNCPELKDAIDEVQNNETIKLLADHDYGEDTTDTNRIEIKDGKNITFDFNGSKIIASKYESKYAAVKVEGSGTKVTFTDSKNNNGGIEHQKGSGALLIDGAEVTITGGTYTSSGKSDDNKNYGAIANYNGTLTINGANVLIKGSVDVFGTKPSLTFVNGTIDSTSFAISGNGSETHDSTILIEGGKLTSTGNTAIYHPQSGTLTITGGEITGKVGIVARQGTINVQGGTITGNGSVDATYTTGDSANILASGSAIIVDNKATGYGDNTVVKITGGVIKASSAVSNAISSYGEEKTADYEVTGGEFNKKFNQVFIKGEDTAEVKLGSNYYVGNDIEKAFENATAGDTIEVLQGNVKATDVVGGVIIKNSGDGEVTVNGVEVTKDKPYITEEKEKDYNIVENVVYADNGEDIDIDGKIVKEEDETYKAMLKMAEDKGYKILYNMYDFWVKDEKTLTKPLTITFNLGESYNGKEAYIIHRLHDGTYQEEETEVKDGKISITVQELSPFTVSLREKEVVDNVQTSSINIVAYGVIATMSLVGIIVLVKKASKNS